MREPASETPDRLRKARQARKAKAFSAPGDLQLEDFYAYMVEHKYIFVPAGQMWPAASVNARCRSVPTAWTRTASPNSSGEHVARPQPPGRADDLGARASRS